MGKEGGYEGVGKEGGSEGVGKEGGYEGVCVIVFDLIALFTVRHKNIPRLVTALFLDSARLAFRMP